jgi:flagellar biosynthesis protein FlhG
LITSGRAIEHFSNVSTGKAMISINDLSHTEIQKIKVACSYLFSAELAGNNEFLEKLEFDSVKNAFIEKEKRYNPDFHKDEPEAMIIKRKERYVRIRESFEILKNHIKEQDGSVGGYATTCGIVIAVGGAKGGTGKSTFAANLGVFLAAKGRRVVLVDLDLGAENLHLYLGERSVKHTINDFLNKRVETLRELMVSTQYGLSLVGGGGSKLGAANIHFARKLKLLKAIKKIDADYIVMDLGASTSYNNIDFFLASDFGIVVTTCNPASYLDAYNFIKVSLHRKLDRIFGPESEFRKQKNKVLELLIKDVTMSVNLKGGNLIGSLLKKIQDEQPEHITFISNILKTYNPNVIVNMSTDESCAMEVANRIQKVSQKMLSIDVGYLGSIPYQAEIERSTQDLVPFVATYPKGILSECINNMLDSTIPPAPCYNPPAVSKPASRRRNPCERN